MSLPAGGLPALSGRATAGMVIAGRYRLSRPIAHGGMGEVWRAYDAVRSRPVAIKLLKPEYLEEPTFLQRFRAEARLAGMLDHPGICAVHDYGEDDGPEGRSAYLVLELVEGEPLSALLHRIGALPPEQALDVVGQAGVALQAAHAAGVVHRDVKPGNLLVRADGTVKITDFGIARATGSVPLTRTGTVLGTAHYLSPEQVNGQPATPASDVYALGVVAYECLTGRRPYEGDSPVEVALAHQRDPLPALPADIPAPVRFLVERATAKDPDQRPPSAGALGRTALAIRMALYADEPEQPLAGAAAPPPAVVDRPPATHVPGAASNRPRRGRLRPPLLVLLALLAVVVVAATVRGCSAGTGGAGAPGGHGRSASAAPGGGGGPVGTSGIRVDPATYRGQSAAATLAALTGLGLAPSRVDVDQPGTPGTVVTIVTPGGAPLPATLPAGAPVLVQTVAGPQPAISPAHHVGIRKGKG